ncbi:hypothetical protein GUY44_06905 [Pimelobacter simplex]|uniref:Phage protein n=1 Tax=Nocardioides simplex TaxID=2045 RepID=A0A0C5XCH3_NOCSI|nr:hypothetical protein [Pimelobacter simplex]AJR18459.1 Phage protein [Pimelobacter simplex]MCG8150200.1 hypothetical protein [Pimelobacter simplex]GEB13590.1 hypothetical protein NSI01_19050 [Pimelobacter simplex]SFM71318.1 hypothetical protein SAMN05421671_3082 [Pimelobacter simplex]
MYDPWDDFELHRLNGWKVEWRPLTDLPEDRLGLTTWLDRTMHLDPDQENRQERVTVTHEVVHIERGPAPDGHEDREERIVDDLTARRLISLEALAEAMVWAYDVDEVAFVLWVDEPSVRVRLRGLTPEEGRYIQEVVDAAEARFPEDVYDDVAWSEIGIAWNGDIERGEEAG